MIWTHFKVLASTAILQSYNIAKLPEALGV